MKNNRLHFLFLSHAVIFAIGLTPTRASEFTGDVTDVRVIRQIGRAHV